ncbi:MAG TPA: c-type cytochrome [Candidatus Methylacidiphilales bacterium]|jgi:cytochrome c oxidase cbb3-type subunit 3|nr:c-type cytochrome [Candidatus Methylacidiphilales bacterium]
MKTKLRASIAIAIVILVGFSGGSAFAADAATLWSTNCAACHGKDGKGSTMMGRKLNLEDLTKGGFSDAQATDAIKNGITKNGNTMKGYGSKLSDADIKALVAYLHTLK